PGKLTAASSLAMLAIVLLLTGCAAGRTSDRNLVLIEYPRLAELIAQAEADGREGGLVIVDARSAEQFAAGHIPAAVNLPLARVTARDRRLLMANHIVVYGRDWQDSRGPAVAKRLIELGYAPVYDFRGGLELWSVRQEA